MFSGATRTKGSIDNRAFFGGSFRRAFEQGNCTGLPSYGLVSWVATTAAIPILHQPNS